MALHSTTATISRSSPRYDEWLEVFGSDTVQLRGPLPVGVHDSDGEPS